MVEALRGNDRVILKVRRAGPKQAPEMPPLDSTLMGAPKAKPEEELAGGLVLAGVQVFKMAPATCLTWEVVFVTMGLHG